MRNKGYEKLGGGGGGGQIWCTTENVEVAYCA